MRKSKIDTACKNIQKMIVSFIRGDLNDSEAEELIEHVNRCSECKEEYDVYYTLLTGMMMLDEDKANEESYAPNSDEYLKKVEEGLIKKKMGYVRRRVLLIGMILLLSFLLYQNS